MKTHKQETNKKQNKEKKAYGSLHRTVLNHALIKLEAVRAITAEYIMTNRENKK